MAITSKQQQPSPAFLQTVEEIMRLFRSLPPRPTLDEVEAAMSVLKSVNTEEQNKLDEIANMESPRDVPEELFSLLQQMRRTTVLFQSNLQRREAICLLDDDKMFRTFDELIQRASGLVSGDSEDQKFDGASASVVEFERESVMISDHNLVKRGNEDDQIGSFKGLVKSSSAKAGFSSAEGVDEKLSLMKVAALIENSASTGVVVIDLKGKLMDQIEWLPVSIGKLSNVTELDLSENQIMALPSTIGSLTALTKLDIHSNQLINLPDSFGELIKLTDLDLHANRLKSLPSTFGNLINLVNLDLGSNLFTKLPDTVGKLTCLKSLTADTNELEELPFTIGSCSSLVELRLDFNNLKALPEAIGKLECLEILSLHYNRIKGLPSTIGNLYNLKELDVSFNELESVPENLCFVVSLVKLNVGKNFADLRALPRSIGNLERLEELDISDCQIRMLPESFGLLSKLRVFSADETPLEVPPRQVIKQGAQAVVKYMADPIAKTDAKSQPPKKNKKGFWIRVCSIFCTWQTPANNSTELVEA